MPLDGGRYGRCACDIQSFRVGDEICAPAYGRVGQVSSRGDKSHGLRRTDALIWRMAKSSSKSARRKAPWKKTAPKGSRHTKLSPSQKAKAKRAAKRAGRPYPNLVDNMRAAKKRKK